MFLRQWLLAGKLSIAIWIQLDLISFRASLTTLPHMLLQFLRVKSKRYWFELRFEVFATLINIVDVFLTARWQEHSKDGLALQTVFPLGLFSSAFSVELSSLSELSLEHSSSESLSFSCSLSSLCDKSFPIALPAFACKACTVVMFRSKQEYLHVDDPWYVMSRDQAELTPFCLQFDLPRFLRLFLL